MIPAPSPHDFAPDIIQSDFQSQINIDALLSYIYPSAPMICSEKMLLPNCDDVMGMNGLHEGGSPPKSMLHPTLPTPQSTTYTSIYVKNVPSDANDLWVYER